MMARQRNASGTHYMQLGVPSEFFVSKHLRALEGRTQSTSITCSVAAPRLAIETLAGKRFSSDLTFMKRLSGRTAKPKDVYDLGIKESDLERLAGTKVKIERPAALDYEGVKRVLQRGGLVQATMDRGHIFPTAAVLQRDTKLSPETVKKLMRLLNAGRKRPQAPSTKPGRKSTKQKIVLRKAILDRDGKLVHRYEEESFRRPEDAWNFVTSRLKSKRPADTDASGSRQRAKRIGFKEFKKAWKEDWQEYGGMRLGSRNVQLHELLVVGVLKRNGTEFAIVYDQNFRRTKLPPFYEFPLQALSTNRTYSPPQTKPEPKTVP